MRLRRSAIALATATAVTSLLVLAAPAQGATASPTTVAINCGHYRLRVIHPSPSFDPLKATNPELKLSGLPPRPSDPSRMATWTRLVTHPIAQDARCRPLAVADVAGPPRPADRGLTAGTPEPAGDLASAGATFNWSGWVAHSHTYTETYAEWHIPKVSGGNTSGGHDAKTVVWPGVGLGQSYTYPLMQAGSESVWNGSTGSYSMWWEVYPQVYMQGLSMSVAAGDDVSVDVTYVDYEHVDFDIYDWTRSTSAHPSYWFPDPAYPSGHSEWITERPASSSGYYFALAKWSSLSFVDAQATYSGSTYSLYQLEPDSYTNYMTNCGGTELANPGLSPNNSGGFPEYFDASGSYQTC